MNNKKISLGLLLSLVVLLPSCMHVPTYKSRSLQSVKDNFAYRGVEKNIIVQAKRLNVADQFYLFPQHVDLIEKENFQIIYLSITNMSNLTYLFSPQSVDLMQIPWIEIACLMRTNSVSRLAGITLSGMGAVPIALIFCYVSLLKDSFIQLPFYVASLIAIPLGFVFLGQGLKSMIMNRRISKDVKVKTLHEELVIKSGDCYDGLIFVKASDYCPQFAVTMHEKDTNKTITFDVDVTCRDE